MNAKTLSSTLVVLLSLAGLACSKGVHDAAATPAPDPAAATDGSARTLPIPGQPMPEGHPPIDDARPAGLAWSLPAGWSEEAPSSNMRIAQFRVPGSAGDGECIVYYFGPGQGGDAASNAQRWAGQFTQPDGRSSIDLMTFGPLDGTQVPVSIVEVTGTYDGGMSGSGEQAGYMLLGGIAEGPDAPWFFKFVGPEATVKAERDAFIGLMKSLHKNG